MGPDGDSAAGHLELPGGAPIARFPASSPA